MPDTFIPSQAGRLEAKYHNSKGGPIVLILHAHPLFGGSMNNPIMYQLAWSLANRGHSVVRFNFRGVGQSDGVFSNEEGELSDANTVLDWAMGMFPGRRCSVIGFSFGAWVGANLMARRPEVDRFVAIAPLVDHYNFNFMGEFCPAKSLFIAGTEDTVVSIPSLEELVFMIKAENSQGDFSLATVEGANHFFDDRLDKLVTTVNAFTDPMLIRHNPES